MLDLVCLVALVDAIIAVKTDVEQTDPAGSGFSWWPWCWPQIPPLRRGINLILLVATMRVISTHSSVGEVHEEKAYMRVN